MSFIINPYIFKSPSVEGAAYLYGGSFNSRNDEYSGDAWTSKTGLPLPGRSSIAATSIENKGYSFGGYETDFSTYSMLNDEYSPDTWVRKTNMLSPGRTAMGCTTVSDSGYIFAGIPTRMDTDRYTPSSNSWLRRSNVPSPTRNNIRATEINDKAYLFGGFQNPTYYRDNDEYTPSTNTWVAKTDLPLPARSGGATATISEKGYSFGGGTTLDVYTRIADNDEYTPSTNTWVAKTDLVIGRASTVSTMLGDSAYLFGGNALIEGVSTSLVNTDKYTPDTWMSMSDMPSPGRSSFGGCSIQ
jgi:N-acetylneuraminic acid mutarotase